MVFFQGSPTGTRTVIGRAVTTRRLLPGESEVVSVRYDVPMAQQREAIPVFVVVNDAREMPLATLHECRPNNNTLGPQPTPCTTPG